MLWSDVFPVVYSDFCGDFWLFMVILWWFGLICNTMMSSAISSLDPFFVHIHNVSGCTRHGLFFQECQQQTTDTLWFLPTNQLTLALSTKSLVANQALSKWCPVDQETVKCFGDDFQMSATDKSLLMKFFGFFSVAKVLQWSLQRNQLPGSKWKNHKTS